MSFEQKINYQLNKIPGAKKIIKRVYQRFMYTISPKIKSEGKIIRISPDDSKHEYFFGYYDKSPWDITDRYMLCMRANDTWSDVSPEEKADILLIDTCLSESDPNRVKKIAETRSWNVQQGCMLQWLGPDFSSRILYNDYRNSNYVAVILELATGKERIIQAPVYTVSADGKIALTLDFSRLYNLRPGYGYYNVPEKTKDIALPDADAVWKINLETGEITALLTYKDFAAFQPRPEMQEAGAVHKVNHLMLSPNGRRCMVLYRWFVGQRKYTRLITFNIDGSDMYVLSDDDMVSHCFWKDDQTILAFENKKDGGPGYYLMKDKRQEYIHCWPQFSNDGHPSYSPDRKLIVTDSYPNRARVASINLMDGNERKTENTTIVRVFAPFKYDNDTRCDLHPRWSHRGDMICFDSVFEGNRGLYAVKLPSTMKSEYFNFTVSQDIKVSCIIPSYKRCDTVTRAIDSVLKQTYKNIEVCLVDDNVPGDEYSQKLKEALKKYEGDNRVRYISQEKHINGAVARNVGIKAATGDYISFLDDDDEWLPEKIERQMKLLHADPTLDACTVLWELYQDGKKIRKCVPYIADDLQLKVFLRSVVIYTSTIIIRKKAIEQFGGFDEKLSRHQDLQFIIDSLKCAKYGVLNEYYVVVHTDSQINRPDVKKLIKVKKDFFRSVSDQFNRYNGTDKKRIMNAHYYEVAFQALKSKDYSIVIKYVLKAGIKIQSIKDLINRIKERKQ